MCPRQYRTGVTPDISAFLQFKLWDCILYLDPEAPWPFFNERTAYWVGVTENIGDALTYWIYDDQMKCLLARSVVRPFCHNHRVKWDPSLVSSPSQYTASNGGDIMPNKSQCDNLSKNMMDHSDSDEHIQDNVRFDADATNKYVDQGFDLSDGLTVPVEQDMYSGSSKLRLSPECLAVDSTIVVPKITSKQPYKEIRYKEPSNPFRH